MKGERDRGGINRKREKRKKKGYRWISEINEKERKRYIEKEI